MLITFYLFRVSLVPRRDGNLFTTATHEDKNQAIADAIRERPEGVYRKTKYQILNPLIEERDDVIHFRLCRPESKDIAVRDPDTGDLVDGEMPSFAWTHGVYTGKGSQIVAIASRVEFFTGKPKNYGIILKQLLDTKFADSEFEPEVIPLSITSKFWEAVKSLDIVTNMNFELIPPNVFGGHENLTGMLKYLGSMIRLKRIKQTFYGDREDGLDPVDEVFGEYSSYAAEGGGSWDVYGIKNGKNSEFHSNSEVRAVRVETSSTDFVDLGDGKAALLDEALGAGRNEMHSEGDE